MTRLSSDEHPVLARVVRSLGHFVDPRVQDDALVRRHHHLSRDGHLVVVCEVLLPGVITCPVAIKFRE